MCYFQKQCADVKYKLFQAYCTSLYGCELWNLLSNDLVALCTAWRKGVRRVWGIPPDTHCYILPLLCKRLPVYDEICRCSANFVRTCLLHNRLYECCSKSCKLWCLWARCESSMGRNALHCMRRYNAGLSDCLYLEICYEGYIYRMLLH